MSGIHEAMGRVLDESELEEAAQLLRWSSELDSRIIPFEDFQREEASELSAA